MAETPLFNSGVTMDMIRQMHLDTQMGLQECKRILTLEAINDAIKEAKSFEDAKPAILALIGIVL